MNRRRAFFNRYKPPAVDSTRARANATMFLTNVRNVDQLNADDIARQYRLKPATAAKMLEQEIARRG